MRGLKRFGLTNLNKVYFMALLTVIGMTAGFIFVSYLSADTENTLSDYMKSYTSQNSDGITLEHMLSTAANNLRNMALIAAAGLSILLLPIIYINFLYRGFVVGFVSCFIAQSNGYAAAVTAILPQVVITIPIMVLFSINTIDFCLEKRKRRFGKSTLYAKFAAVFAIFLLVSMLCIPLEMLLNTL